VPLLACSCNFQIRSQTPEEKRAIVTYPVPVFNSGTVRIESIAAYVPAGFMEKWQELLRANGKWYLLELCRIGLNLAVSSPALLTSNNSGG
jgi:hypothetical protein